MNKATRTIASFYWSMTLFFSQVSCYVRYKGIYRQSLFRWSIFIYTRDCRFSLRKSPVKLDTSQNYLPFLYTAPIYKNTYTEYPSDIETGYKTNWRWHKELCIIFLSVSKQLKFRHASVLIFPKPINKFFEQQTPYRAESSTQSSRLIFSPLDIIVGFTDKQFSIVNK